MLYCEKCNVKIRTNHKYCPLCQSPLIGEIGEDSKLFPELEEKTHASKLMLRIFNFLCVAIIIISLMVNWLITPGKQWSIWIGAGVLCVWIFLTVGVYKRKNLMKNAMWQLFLITVGTVIWDAAIGWSGWSVNYVIPIAGLVTIIILIVIAMVYHLASPEYMIYFLMNCLYGIIPFILLLTGCITVKLPALLCICCCALLFSALIIFQGRAVYSELQKKFHL
ncbi:hypothetical protein NDGK_00265 [Clostridiales bacterium CHKCI001]|nr:hypothetical protein NDGK_00265 [Clostridiales bacterium CHKCI001]